mmetsp:Transcript_9857/g.14516  ORF Transcript_9857/g.14516 Transcript_9857/m.14516 type:complete len:403 (-) Transcript_9857:242-1450(-)
MKRNSVATMMPVVLVCLTCWIWYSNLFLYTSSSSLILPSNNQQQNTDIAEHHNTEINSGGSFICPSAVKLIKNITELRSAIDSQTRFHQQGGNLASIEGYLNDQMQNTLDRLEVEFVPKQANQQQQLPSIQYLRQYYKTHQVKRGGYGQPLPGKWRGRGSREGKKIDNSLVGNRWIEPLEPSTSQRYAVAVGPVGAACSNITYFGKGKGDEKVFCTSAENDDDNGCNIFSIGSNDNWGFESEVLQKLPGCKTHTFDCTLPDNIPKKKPTTVDVAFYPFCIGSNDSSEGSYRSYQSLVAETNIKSPPKLLKMDIEGFEFGVLSSMLATDRSMWPEQIMMEVHWATRMVDVSTMLRTRQAAELSLFFGMLFTHGGYIPIHIKYFDPICGSCMELLLVRAVCHDS